MFDGNHRIRRTVNLGGASTRRGRGGGGGRRTTTGPSSSSLASSKAAASGIPDRKAQLIETARIERERRREVARRNDAARNVQRTFRGWVARRALVGLNAKDGGGALVGRYGRLLEELRSRQKQQHGTTARAAAAAAGELASVLCMLLSPPLLPFLVRGGADGSSNGNKNRKKKKSASAAMADRGKRAAAVLELLLQFRSVLDALSGIDGSSTGTGTSPQRQQRRQLSRLAPSGASDAAESAARECFVRSRIARRALEVLTVLASKEKVATTAAVGASAGGAAASRLAGLVSLLLGCDVDGTCNTYGDGGGDGDSSNAVLLARVLRNSFTVPAEGYGPVLLFLCFRDWFRVATASTTTSTTTTSSEEGRVAEEEVEVAEVTGTLLRLSTGAASSLASGATAGEEEGGGDDARSILAAALFTSGRRVGGGISGGGDGEGGGDPWSGELDRCVVGAFSASARGGGSDNVDGSASEVGYVSLLASLVRTLQLSDGGGGANSAAASAAVSAGAKAAAATCSRSSDASGASGAVRDAVRSMVAGREAVLLANALDRLLPSGESGGVGIGGSGSSTRATSPKDEEFTASKSILLVKLLRYVLTKRRTDLAVVSSLVARGEDVRSFLSPGRNGAAEFVDLTNDGGAGDDVDDESSSDTDGDVEEEEESGGGRGPMLGPQQQHGTASGIARPPSAALGPGGGGGARPRYKRPHQASRQSRSDVQTVPKLDRLYQAEVAGARREALLALRGSAAASAASGGDEVELLVSLAERIGSGSVMSSLGASIFAKTAQVPLQAKLMYATVLSDLLQSTTSSRVRNATSSPLLSKLAFNPGFLGEFWAYIASSPNGADFNSDSAAADAIAAKVAFCDVFGHHLMAVDDEEFLDSYAGSGGGGKVGNNNGNRSNIVAEDVVSHIRNVLHELFWSKPVLSRDVSVPSRCDSAAAGGLFGEGGDPEASLRCHRARLLLSATKLWNSLYERWCRLYRSAPFCDERTWWFPRLVTRERDDDGAVMVGGVAAAMHHDDDDDEMHESDSESERSPMDVDDASLDGDGGGTSPNAAASQQPTAAEEENDALASSFSDPKMARILTSIPQALPFDRRVKLFNALLAADKARTQDETRAFRQAMMVHMRHRGGDMDSDEEFEFTGREQAEIRRDRLYEDSMDQLNKLGRKLRRRVQVTLISKHGTAEAGIDGGGVFKEFLDDLIKEAFDPRPGRAGNPISDGSNVSPSSLFAVTPIQTLTVNVDAMRRNRDILSHYEFLGRVLGKAVYESILVEPQFCLPFLNSLLGKQNSLDDMKNLDPEYYRHLNGLRKMSTAEIDGLGLTFELTGGEQQQRTVELIPGGSTVQVTKQNAIRYIHLVAHRKLNVESAVQTHAFLRGFRDLIPAAWVRLFSAHELQKLISGDDTVKGIDVNGMRGAMQYSGGYHPSQPIIRWLWEVVEEMTPTQQRDFLRFMTSCSRQPLLGFQALVPLPCVQQIRRGDEGGGEGDVRLPTSSTCMNLLKLPNYGSKDMLREKLLYAIEAGAGFELS